MPQRKNFLAARRDFIPVSNKSSNDGRTANVHTGNNILGRKNVLFDWPIRDLIKSYLPTTSYCAVLKGFVWTVWTISLNWCSVVVSVFRNLFCSLCPLFPYDVYATKPVFSSIPSCWAIFLKDTFWEVGGIVPRYFSLKCFLPRLSWNMLVQCSTTTGQTMPLLLQNYLP